MTCLRLTAQQGAVDSFNKNSEEKLAFQLHPNPMTGNTLNIVSDHTGLMTVLIVNILGEVVYETTTYEHFITPNNLKAGIYIVKIMRGGRQGLGRLVVPWAQKTRVL